MTTAGNDDDDEDGEGGPEHLLPGASRRLASIKSAYERGRCSGSPKEVDGRAALRKMFGYQRHYKLAVAGGGGGAVAGGGEDHEPPPSTSTGSAPPAYVRAARTARTPFATRP